jgi:transcriptional regulator with XRE-family HTH domain
MLHLYMLPFGQTVLLWRAARGLTQAQLAEASGVPRPNLSAIERGAREVSLRTIRALAAALSINPGTLVDGQSPQPASTLSFSRQEMDRIAHAAVRGEQLPNHEENTVALEMRELSRPRLEAAGIVVPRTTRGRRMQTRQELSIRHHLPPAVLKSLLERMSDESNRNAA